MKTHGLSACALFAGCAAIAACSQTTEFSRFLYAPSVNAPEQGTSRQFKELYSFGENPDGALPTALLIDVDGTLYGTTSRGGIYDHGGSVAQGGTVFSMTTNGTEKVLHSFGGSGDGYYPYAALINVRGRLYGTTEYGGNTGCHGFGCGTVFSITTSGSEKILHNFGYPDGAMPAAGLIDVDGTLYGTTVQGGIYNGGTVFSITTSGTEKVLYSFGSLPEDGLYPYAGLLNVKGTLYGTTAYGGSTGRHGFGYGTVFSITTRGTEKVLYGFGSTATDGNTPLGALVDVGGILYGTTFTGGGYNVSRGGYGTVFSVTTSGKEKVLYSFGYGPDDGQYPYAGLLNVKGTLYGTNNLGGAHGLFGTVFSVTTSGIQTVLHSFGTGERGGLCDHGCRPRAGLIEVAGKLYSTTWGGGERADGTVFVLRP